MAPDPTGLGHYCDGRYHRGSLCRIFLPGDADRTGLCQSMRLPRYPRWRFVGNHNLRRVPLDLGLVFACDHDGGFGTGSTPRGELYSLKRKLILAFTNILTHVRESK